MKPLLYTILSFIALAVIAQSKPVVQIKGNALDRHYKVYFSSDTDYSVAINIADENGESIATQTMYGKGFVRSFDLSSLEPGNYQWVIIYGNRTYIENFEIRTEKELLKNSIDVNISELNIDITVEDYNQEPMNIFVYNEDGEQLEYEFWVPSNGVNNKKIDLGKISEKEIKVEIEQAGKLTYSKSHSLD